MNLKRFLSFTKYALLIVVALTTIGISSCSDDDDDNNNTTPTVYDGTIMDMIKSDQFKQGGSVTADMALDSLVKFLEYHDLDEVLKGTGPYTLFAPSNTAFKNLLATPGFPQNIKKIAPDVVKGVLSYHVVPGSNKSSALTSGASFSTAFTGTVNNPDDKIIVNSDGTLKTGAINQSIQIVDADNEANNGVVHITGSVLIPQSVGSSLTSTLGTIAGTVLLGSDFTYMAKVIMNADQGVSAEQRISTLLAIPNPAVNPADAASTIRKTFFAVPNPVFAAAAQQAGVTVDQFIASLGTGANSPARAILLNHIVTSNEKHYYVVSDIAGTTDDIVFTSGGLDNATNAGKTLTVILTDPNPQQSNPYGVVITSPSEPMSQAPVVSKDIAASNGIIQVVAGFLKPQ